VFPGHVFNALGFFVLVFALLVIVSSQAVARRINHGQAGSEFHIVHPGAVLWDHGYGYGCPSLRMHHAESAHAVSYVDVYIACDHGLFFPLMIIEISSQEFSVKSVSGYKMVAHLIFARDTFAYALSVSSLAPMLWSKLNISLTTSFSFFMRTSFF